MMTIDEAVKAVNGHGRSVHFDTDGRVHVQLPDGSTQTLINHETFAAWAEDLVRTTGERRTRLLDVLGKLPDDQLAANLRLQCPNCPFWHDRCTVFGDDAGERACRRVLADWLAGECAFLDVGDD